MTKQKTLPPLGVVAGIGEQPLRLIEHLKKQKRGLVLITLKGISDGDYSDFPHQNFAIGALNSAVEHFKSAGCVEVVFAGYLRRPSLASIEPDLRLAKLLGKVLFSGDDSILRAVRADVAKDGLKLLDIAEVLDVSKAQYGLMAGKKVSAEIKKSIKFGGRYLDGTAGFDIGQACIVQGQRILAIEAAEGTDAMIKRCASLIDPNGPQGVLVKMLKPDQDPKLDPPGIGTKTMKAAADSGIKIIAVEADGVVLVDGIKTTEAAEKLGLTLIGFRRNELK